MAKPSRDGGLAFEAAGAIPRPSGHSSVEGASASSELRAFDEARREVGAPRRVETPGASQEASEGNVPSVRAEDNAARAGRSPRASIEGPPGSRAPVSDRFVEVIARSFRRSMRREDRSPKLVRVVKRTRPESFVEASRLGGRDAAARAAMITSGVSRFVSGARTRESVAAVGEEHLFLLVHSGVAGCGGPVSVGRRRSSSQRVTMGAGGSSAHLKPAQVGPPSRVRAREDQADGRRSGAQAVTP